MKGSARRALDSEKNIAQFMSATATNQLARYALSAVAEAFENPDFAAEYEIWLNNRKKKG